MPSPTLDDTLGGASSNSYIDVDGAGAYFANLMSFDAWDGLADDDLRARALISATAALEELEFWGTPVSADQALAFPRYFAGQSDGLSIPKRILDACCELALSVAQVQPGETSGPQRMAALRAAGVQSFRLGDLSASFGGSSAMGSASALAEMPARVQRLVSGWVKASSQMDSGRRTAGGRYDQNGLWWPSELSD